MQFLGGKFSPAMLISLLLAVICVVGGMQLAVAGSEKTPWPEAGMVAGWVIYRAGWSWWRKRAGWAEATV